MKFTHHKALRTIDTPSFMIYIFTCIISNITIYPNHAHFSIDDYGLCKNYLTYFYSSYIIHLTSPHTIPVLIQTTLHLNKYKREEYHMNKIAHAITGFTLGTQLAYNLQPVLQLSPSQYLFCVATVTFGSLLPDIDTPYSYLGRKLKLVSYPIYKIFGHRTITHSLLVWSLLLFISPLFNTGLLYGLFCISLYGGVVSHIILDIISTTGVPLLYPLCNIRFHLIPRLKRNKSTQDKIKHKKRLPI